ncbi:MAG TPA: N-alpha-acetyl diaminobutyric acid deacetylase DoeB [Rhizobiales bacterium]|nr:N-alpha-acetyl diaminobutyric acid deacetylase DoeB [Hyphomicrobiales bacterium]
MPEKLTTSPVTSTIDFQRQGIWHGFLQTPHSRNDSAWGSIMTPICVINNGPGPTALLTGGNHGDEYEGPIALFDLANNLNAEKITGRIIIVPAMNYPAFQAGTRLSPIDNLNMNRTFPGNPRGTATEKMADYFTRILLPMADYVLDFHSGGKTLDFVPFAASHILDDKHLEAKCEAAVQAFNAPCSVKMLEIDSVGMYDSEAESQGKVFITTELAGGGTSTPQSVAIAKRGVHNFLVHAGILQAQTIPAPVPGINIRMENSDCFTFSQHHGMIEHLVSLGDTVTKGDALACIHNIDQTGIEPETYSAKQSGLVICQHVPGLIQSGDCLAVTGSVIP